MSERPLWAPWRIEYITGPKEGDCIFCLAGAANADDDNLVVRRGQCSVVMLNRFPYAPGHLMVAPYRHVSELDALSPGESSELMGLAKDAVAALRAVMAPQGFNVGLNLGRAAGAGIAEHLHLHVVPRWEGDMNFMPLLADSHVIPQALAVTRKVVSAAFPR